MNARAAKISLLVGCVLTLCKVKGQERPYLLISHVDWPAHPELVALVTCVCPPLTNGQWLLAQPLVNSPDGLGHTNPTWWGASTPLTTSQTNWTTNSYYFSDASPLGFFMVVNFTNYFTNTSLPIVPTTYVQTNRPGGTNPPPHP